MFWILSLLAVLDSVKMIKVNTVLFEKKEDMYRYTIIGHYVFTCIKRMYLAALISSGSHEITQLFDELKTVSRKLGGNTKKAVSQIIL